MRKLKKLFKKTSTGKIQVWIVLSHKNQVKTIYGTLDGKKQSTMDTIKGKNIGKANETSPAEQAILKMKQLWDKQIKKGYVDNLEDAKAGISSVEGPKPMLAFPIQKKESYVVYPAIGQCKLDGMRCFATILGDIVKLFTRTGKPIKTLPHIVKDIKKYFGFQDQLVITDGELYNHELKDDFNRIIKMIKRDETHPESKVIQYHIYDSISELPYERRTSGLSDVIMGSEYLKDVPWQFVNDREELEDYFQIALDRGYEGAMYRNPNMPYDNVPERSVGLLKVKVFDDDEFVITGVLEGEGKLQGTAGSIWCVTPEGMPFKTSIKAYTDSKGKRVESKEDFQARRLDWFKNIDDLKGQEMTVQYQGKTPIKMKDNKQIGGLIPRFPVALRIRIPE